MKITSLVSRLAVLITALTLSVALPLNAQEFEGILRIRLLDVDVDKAESLRTTDVAALLALPTEYLLQLKSRDGTPAVSTSLRTYLIKDRRIRLEADQGDESSYTLINLETKTIRMVSPETETYYEISIPELTRPLFPLLRQGGYMVRPLNKTMKVNGMEATAYEAVAEDNIVRAWLTQEYPSLTRLLEELARAIPMPNATAEERILGLAELGAPVLVQLVDMDGTKLDDYEVQEIIAIRVQPLDSRLFSVPDGYQRIDH